MKKQFLNIFFLAVILIICDVSFIGQLDLPFEW